MIYSDSCLPLSIRIVQGTADFWFDEIKKFADKQIN
jgi:hypothetical protein